MNKQLLLEELVKKYELKDNYYRILRSLLNKDLSAEEILKKTRVSSGRIYKLLGELEEMGLIERISGKPALYSSRDFPQKVRNFLTFSFDSFVDRQTSISKMLAELEDEIGTDVIHGSREKYDYEIMEMLKRGEWVKILHKDNSFPWFIYIHDQDKFLKIRQGIKKRRRIGSSPLVANLLLKRENYFQVYKSKQVEHIMSWQAFQTYIELLDKLFGKEGRKRMVKDLIQKLKKYPNVKIFLLENLYNPFSTYITDQQAFIVFFFENNENRILKLTGKELIEIYKKFFNRYLKGSQNILPHLKKHSA